MLNGSPIRIPTGKFSSAVLGLLLIASPLFALASVVRLGINFPMWDDWSHCYGVSKYVLDGPTDWGYVFSAHGIHFTVVTRLFYAALGKWFGWNLKVAMVANLGMVLISLLSVCYLIRRTVSVLPLGQFALMGVASFAMFSMVQWRLFLSAWGHCWLLLPLLLRLGMTAVERNRGPAAANFILLMVLSVIGSLTMGGGLALWIAFPFYALLIGWAQRLRPWPLYLAIWLLGALTLIGAYGYGFAGRATNVYGADVDFMAEPDARQFSALDLALKSPVSAIGYFLALLGSSVAIGSPPEVACSQLFGFLSLAGFAGCLIYLVRFRTDRPLIVSATPWATLCMFELGIAALIVIGRIGGYPVTRMLDSHYSSIGIHFIISAAILAVVVLASARRRFAETDRARIVHRWVCGAVMVAVAMLVFHVSTVVEAVQTAQVESVNLRRAEVSVHLTPLLPEQGKYPPLVLAGPERVARMASAGILRIASFESLVAMITRAEAAGSPLPGMGRIDGVLGDRKGVLRVTGSVSLGKDGRRPDGVVFVVRSALDSPRYSLASLPPEGDPSNSWIAITPIEGMTGPLTLAVYAYDHRASTMTLIASGTFSP